MVRNTRKRSPKSQLRSDFRIIVVTSTSVFLEDLDLGRCSVTNDAENVVRFVNNTYPLSDIFYRDSLGHWSELLHNNGEFERFHDPLRANV